MFRCLISIPEHMRSLFIERPRGAVFPEHMRSVLSTNLLTCNFFRSICGQFLRSQGSATFFRSMCSHFSQVSEYLCGSFQYNKDSNSKDIMAGKTKDMSDVRKVLQLHEQKVSNRKVAKQLGLDKNTVNRYIATLSNLNMKVSDLLRMEDPELEKMFFSGSPAYTDERMDTFLEELPASPSSSTISLRTSWHRRGRRPC